MSAGVRAIVFKMRDSTGPIDTPWGSELRKIEKRIWDSEKAGLRARWESGRHILTRREGKQLPKGLLKHLCAALEVSQRELASRTKFAETYSTESELSKALAKFENWNQVIQALPKTRTRKKATPSTIRAAVVHGVVLQCRHFQTRTDIPDRVASDLRSLYLELQRLFKE